MTPRLRSSRALDAALLACLCLAPAQAGASITPISSGTELNLVSRPAINGVLSGVAFDDKHHVYLRVWESNRQVYGLFVGDDGTVKGDVFPIGQAMQSFAGGPRVAYSSGSSDDVFLVIFHTDYSLYDNGKTVFGQLIRYTGGGGSAAQFVVPQNPVPGTTNFALSNYSLVSTFVQTTGDVIYNPVRKQFLTVWDDSRGGYDVVASLVTATGALPVVDANISAAPQAQGAPSAAYDSAHDRYLVVYQGLHPQSPAVPELVGSWAKLVSGADLSIIHPERPNNGLIEVMSGSLALEVNTVFLPQRQAFLSYWTGFGGARDVVGRVIPWNYGDSGADFATNIYPIHAMSFNEGAADAEYNTVSGTVLVPASSDARVLRGIELDSNGIPTSASYNLSTPVPANGSFFPKVAVGDGGRFAVSYITDYAIEWLERFQASSSGGGGGTPAPASTPVPSTFTAPTSGAQVTAPVTFQWASRSDAQGYYLYVGTSSGAKNLVDTGQISATSYTASSLPSGTLYAKIWTLQENVWRGNEITFSVANPLPPQAAFTYPANGARNVDQGQPFQWTAVSGAQAYYLYVGTTLGAKNIVDTGEIQTTTYAMSNLPASQTLYARIYTKQNGIWRFNDVSFTAAAALPSTLATLTYPTNGEAYDPARAIRWSSVPGAQAYYLYVGTSPGAKNVLDSGEIGSTGYTPATAIPVSNRLYASIYTKYGGKWYSVNSEFYVPGAGFIYPTNGALNVDMTYPIRWMPVANAQAYYLYVGTSPGAKDVVDTGEIQTNTFAAPNVPSGQWLYATIWTKAANVWTSRQVMFTATPTNTGGVRSLATLLDPNNGSADADSARLFRWTPAASADKYYLYVGTAPGAKNVVDTGEVSTIAMPAPQLPAGQTLYARVWSRIGGVWQGQDSAFTSPGASMIYPVNNGSMSAAFPLRWTSAANAEVYYLYVGTSPGAKNLVDSGEITRTEYVATNLPVNQTLYATIWTKAGGVWRGRAITFVVKP